MALTNKTKLIIHKMSMDAIPYGGGVEAGIRFLSSRDRIKDGYNSAAKWVDEAIILVRLAADPNPWKTADDEAICGELLRQVELRKKSKK